jgi:hypothetical protein
MSNGNTSVSTVRERADELQKAGLQYYEEQMENLNIGVEPVQNLSDIHEQIKTEALDKLKPVYNNWFYNEYMKTLYEVII